MSSIAYYNTNAEKFVEATFGVEMESIYQPFLKYLPDQALILDVGCGSGRDSLAFKNKGYDVEAIDYSEALVNKATELTGIAVRHQSFYDIKATEVYDGIWACASLLHCERLRLVEVLQKLSKALKPGGVLYMSFKYGDGDREKDGRYFTDLNEEQAVTLLQALDDIRLLQQWITVDQRPERREKWLNILIGKESFGGAACPCFMR